MPIFTFAKDTTNPDIGIIAVPGFTESFNRPDQATLGSTSSEGRAWNFYSAGGGTVRGRIAGNAATADGGSGTGLDIVDAQTANGTLTTVIKSKGTRVGGIALRFNAVNNYIRINPGGSSGTKYSISKIVAGVTTVLATSTGADVADGDVVVTTLAGNSITVKVNGVDQFGTLTVSELATETKFGLLWAAGSTISWESMALAA